jgi:prefoldin subunit 5
VDAVVNTINDFLKRIEFAKKDFLAEMEGLLTQLNQEIQKLQQENEQLKKELEELKSKEA